jgi:Tol biopolymer transport system component
VSLTPGTRLGTYEIVAPLGAGGMGEVYRATDTSLGREVAVKVLPDAVAADEGRVARFEREARTLATLNHPHIAQVYGLERSGTTPALVMELVEGPTLADRIARGPVPMEEALAIATQIAEAREAAHARGIVHRDLKPANVKVRPDGTVKVLDFGLAKALGPADGGSSMSGGLDLTASPTLTTPAMTQMGLVLGTAAYMAPEQARGQAVDRRADIWAFGCVLYEMLTGRRAFDADDVSMTLAEVLKTDPDLTALPAATPEPVRRLLRRCLQKNPAHRLHDIADARLEIADATSEPEVAASTSSAPVAARRDWLAWSVAAALLLALAGVGWFAVSRPADEVRALRLAIQLPEGLELALSAQTGVPTSLLVSPDGRRLAVIARDANGQDTILVRGLDSPTFQPLTGTEGVTSMFWSPDSGSLAFMARNTLRRISVSGGPPVTIASISGTFGGGTWGRNGTIVFSVNEGGVYPLKRVPDGGGEPQTLAGMLPLGIRPWFLPDGEHMLFTGAATDEAFGAAGIPLYVAGLDGSEPIRLGMSGSSNVQYAQGHILFLRDGTLMAWPFDAGRLETTGDPFPVAENVEGQGSVPPYGLFSVSSDGLLVYRSGGTPSGDASLTWFDRAGTPIDTIGRPASYVSVELSPDDRQAAVAVGASADAVDLWLIDLMRGVDSRLTFGAGPELYPVWSPDGRRIVFGGAGASSLDLFEKSSDGTGTETPLLDDDLNTVPMDWSGDRLLYAVAGSGSPDLHLMSVSGDVEPYALLDSEFQEGPARLSPDGGWVAYASNEAGGDTTAVYVARVTGVAGERARGKVRVSAGPGTMPRWRGDGRELFYYDPDRDALMAVEVDGSGETFNAGVAQPLFEFGRRLVRTDQGLYAYEVTSDGERILAILSGTEAREAASPVTVIVNWLAASGR